MDDIYLQFGGKKSILINADLHREMKEYCLLRSVTIKKFIIRIIEMYKKDMDAGKVFFATWDLDKYNNEADTAPTKSIIVPVGIHNLIKNYCDLHDIKIKGFIEQAIAKYLAEYNKISPKKQ